MKIFNKNKKGMFGMTDLVSILIIALILIVFWMIIYFSSLSAEKPVIKIMMDSDVSNNLLNLLRTNIEFKGKNMNVADFFSFAVELKEDDEYNKKMNELLNFEIFNKIYDCYSISLLVEGESIYIKHGYCGEFSLQGEVRQAVPLRDGKSLEVFFIGQKNE